MARATGGVIRDDLSVPSAGISGGRGVDICGIILRMVSVHGGMWVLGGNLWGLHPRPDLGPDRDIEYKKGIRWMPWHQEAMKDVARCEKPRGAASRR